MQFKLPAVHLLYRKTLLRESILRAFASDPVPKERKKRPVPKEPPTIAATARLVKELEEYFPPDTIKLLEKFPPSLLKRGNQNTERFYLASPESAKVISKHVTARLPPELLLAEVNPGPGLLTKELLRKKANKLLLLETESDFEADLRNLLATSGDEGPDRTQLKLADFNGQWRQCYLDSMDQGGRLEKLFEGFPRKRWKGDQVSFRLFSAVGSMRFFKTLISSLVNQKGLFTLGRCEMVLAVPPLLYVHLTCSKDAGYKLYRSTTVLFQLLFEHEFLAKLPRRDFLPWPATCSTRKNRTQHWQLGLVGSDEWYLMRIVPRRDIFDHCLPDNLRLLAFFVAQNLVSRKNRVIPALERWIPFCGARLILNQNFVTPAEPTSLVKVNLDPPAFQRKSSPIRGNDFPARIHIFTEFGELTPSQILTVFNEFINWPEFRQSPFLQTMEQHHTKQSFTQISGSTDGDEEDETGDESGEQGDPPAKVP